jgi:hypothetical protein
MDVNVLVDEMTNLASDLDGMPKGPRRSDLVALLAEKRAALRDWKRTGGFEPRMGWTYALAL